MTTPVKEIVYDHLPVSIYEDNETMGQAAAEIAAATIRETVAEQGIFNLLLATGNSQLTFLHSLREMGDLPWPAVQVFHLDEYVNLPPGHPASFPSFLRHHIVDQVPIGAFYPVPGRSSDMGTACRAYELLLRAHPIDLCCLGIGENGHLAFNEPSIADFEDPDWVKVVELEEQSRHQQVGEGHFASLDQVPTHAITLTIPALRAATKMLCLVPEKRKAKAVHDALLGPVNTDCPASILRQTPQARLFLDHDSAAEIL
jgi:glucosamine-6-phosphate deaminase